MIKKAHALKIIEEICDNIEFWHNSKDVYIINHEMRSIIKKHIVIDECNLLTKNTINNFIDNFINMLEWNGDDLIVNNIQNTIKDINKKLIGLNWSVLL